MKKSEEEWKKKLTPEQFHILRKKGTELPFTGKYLYSKEKGYYVCAGCGARLFSSGAKFDSGTGWPSFWKSVPGSVRQKSEKGLLMRRAEVLCSRCGGHLGHVFSDGPATIQRANGTSVPASGKRFCINSAAMRFKKSKN